MPDLGEEKEGGQVIYSEIEIGKVSELQVKWCCFAGRVALQDGQTARGSSLEAAWNLSPAPQPRAPKQLPAPESHPWMQENIFLVLRGAPGVEKLLQNENKSHANWSLICSPLSLKHCSAFQPSFFNPKLKLSRFKEGIIK